MLHAAHRTVLLVVALALASCREQGPPGPVLPEEPPPPTVATDDIRGGTRLAAVWLEGEGGVAVPPIHWNGRFVDRTLGTRCDFVPAADGVLRCLPHDTLYNETYLDWGRHYTDATCQTRTAYWPWPCVAPPAWQAIRDATTCPVTMRMAPLGSKLAPGVPIYERVGGSCISWGAAGDAHYALGPEAPASDFVAAAPGTGPARDGLEEARLVATDGSIMVLGLRPAGATWRGRPMESADGTDRLLPLGAVDKVSSRYSDAACSNPAVVLEGACAEAPALATAMERGAGCGQAMRVIGVGARVQGLYASGAGGACGLQASGGSSVFATTGEVAPEAFPSAVRATLGGRLTQAAWAVGQAWTWRDDRVFDTALATRVMPGTTADGVQRWVPAVLLDVPSVQGAGEAWDFADEACTERVVIDWTSSCETGTRWAIDLQPAACAAGATYWEVGAPHAGPVYTRVGPAGACVVGGFPGAPYLRLGPQAAPGRFAPLTQTLR